MTVPRLLKRNFIRWRTLHKAVTICVLASLFAGLIPPPLVRSALPTPLAEAVTNLLPEPTVAQAAGGSITGTVFQDYNADGLRNTTSTTALPAVDNGVGDVTVTAYDADGSQCGQTTTSATSATLGQYTLAHTCTATTVRVEFTGLPTDYQSGPQGTNSGTSVQFVSATASNVNYGINHPCDYCQNAPTLATTYMVAGNQMTNTGVSALPNTKVVVSFGYNSTTSTGAPTGEATAKQVGTTVGLAYQRSTKTIFVGAYMKRHAGFGPGGPGAIYKVNPGADGVRGNSDDVISTFLDLDSAAYFGAGSFGTDPHPTSTENIAQTPYNWFHDNQSLDDVSKMAFGDLDMSEDDQDLYTVNLFDRALYRIPVGNPPVAPTKAAIITVSVPLTLPNTGANALASGSASNQHQTCASGDVRPFGLGIHRQAVYVGLVCSAQSTQLTTDLRAYIYSFDPTTNSFGTAPVLEFPLTYTRSGNFTKSWKPYMDTFATLVASTATDGVATFTNYPQPILSDIVFDRGAMVLGFRDRAGDQLGKYAGDVGTGAPGNFYYVAASGDMLRACANASNGWTVENDGTCGGVTTTGSSSTNAGPGGGEFYLGDKAPYPNGTNHVEASEGTLAQVPGAPEVIMSAIDATGLNSGGFEWLNNTTGALADAYEVYQSTSPSGAPSSPSTSQTPDTTFGKAGGIGDVEALCDPAPIQIGNRVWNDANSNGIQDPGESPIQNITVELYKAGTKVGQATTSALGEYYFTSGTSSSDSNTNDNTIHDGGMGIRSATGTVGDNSDYEIRIPNVTGGSKQAALGTNVLTTANAGSKESIDSDGAIPSGQTYATYAIPYADLASAGYNNHTYDFGFGPQPTTGTIQIVKNTVGGDATFTFTSADSELDAVSITTVGNTGDSGTPFTKNAGTYTISEDAPPANWALTSLSCTGDDDSGSVVTLASRQVAIDLDAGETIVCTFTNTYTAPNPGGFTISKAIATTDGSSPSVSGSFDVVVSCAGVSGYPATLSLNANGTPITAGNLVSGTVCSFSEDTLTLPNAPSGYTWVNAQINPASITIGSNVTATVTTTNWLAPLPTQPTGVLTITKGISGTGSGPFDLTITGPSGYLTTTTIDDGQTKLLTELVSGVYTVTESTPAGWTTVYTATPGSVSSVSGVVTVANENTATLASTPISGMVFRDFNSDGQITANGAITDTGIAGVTVTAYDKAGNSVGSATTDSNGDYTITPTGDGPYRVEFSGLPSGYQPTTQGAGNGTSIQFVTTSGQAGNVNFGVGLPSQYCEDNPTLATTCLRTTGASAENAVVSFPLNDTLGGVFNNTSQTPAIAQTTHATQSVIGAVYGLAWQRTSQTLFAGAFGKVNSDFGPAGPGGLYAIDLNNHTTSVFIDFDSPAYFGAGSVGSTVGNDASLVGKVGLGDVELAEDEETLYTINLHTKELYVIPVGVPPTAPAVSQIDLFPLPGSTQSGAPTAPANCPSADHVHPFALAWQDDQLYVGLVCGDDMGTGVATTRTNLRAYVYAFDGAAFTQKLDISLDYLRDDQSVVANHNNHAWVRWNSNQPTLRDQPWLTDIAFDGDDMLLGLRARNGDQGSGADTAVRGGELLRACADGAGGWTIENGGSCGGVAQTVPATSAWTGLAIDEHGPGGSEWYWDDDGGEGEAVTGGLAQIPGRAYLLTTHADGTGMNGQIGVWGLHNASGAVVGGANLLAAFTGTDFGKAGNLGDLEVLCDAAPTEIGNRVWDDLNGDGVQDPGEPGLNGLTVSLQTPTGISTTVTSGEGAYYFTVQPHTDYTITVGTPSGYSLTLANEDSIDGTSASSNHAISDTRDSDAVLVGGMATIYYTTGSAGQNNHGLDFGFTQPASGQVDILNIAPNEPLVSLGNRVWYDTNNNGAVDGGEQNVSNGVVVELYQDSDGSGDFSAGDSRVASTVTSGGYYTFTDLTTSSSDATRYLVVITDTNFLPNGLLYGYHNSAGQVTDNSLAADNDKDHGAVSGTLGQSGGVVASNAISLTAGTQPTGEANEGNDPIQSSSDADSNQTIDFGFYSLSVGNRVWIDDGAGANADNGQLDSGESGLEGITVELLDSGNAMVSMTTTSNGGYYTFTGLISGTYSVRISGYSASYRSSTDTVNAAAPTDADDDDNAVGTNAGTLTSAQFSLIPGSTTNGHTANNVTGITSNPRLDFGLYLPIPVLYDWGDLPDDDSSAGSPTSPGYHTNITDTVGASHVITPGLYLGAAVDDESDGQSSGDATGDGADEDGIALPTFTAGENVVVTVTVVNTTGHTVTLYGFIDWNGDGTFDDDNETVTQTVSASGVVPMTFNVPANVDTTQLLGARFRLSTDTDLGPDGAASDGEVEDYLIAVAPKVSLGNRLWYDTNNDGSVTAGEQNVADGVVVELYQDSDSSGGFSTGDSHITSTLTSGGYYTFTNLMPSLSAATRYIIVITDTNFLASGLLAGYVNSSGQYTDTLNTAGDNQDHGTPLPAFGGGAGGGVVIASSAISLTAGLQPTGEGNEGNDPLQSSADINSNQTIDFGFYKLVWGNRIWEDLNNNGIDDSEPALSSLLVVTATNQATSELYTTTTDVNGYYTFTGIVSGTYVVSFQALVGYVSSSTDGNPNAADLDDNGVGSSGGVIRSAPFALTPGVTINGVQTVTNATGSTVNPSVDFGVWQPAALGNYVWLDTTTTDGSQNETTVNGVNGVTVTLFYSNPVSGLWEQGAVTTTANNPTNNAPGYYTFTNLISGTYYVSFTLPSGYTFTTQNAAGSDETNDSDANTTSGATAPVTLNAGERNPNVDAGLLAPTLSLGNRVWYDVNNNGRIDSSESGLAGVRVELYRDSDGSGAYTPGVDTFVTFSNTVNGGYYSFTNLSEGGYVVVISSTNFSGVLLSYRSSDPTTTDPNDNVDSDDNGAPVAGGVVASGVITLTLGNEPDGAPDVDGDNDANTNWTVDFGFYLVDLGDAPDSYSTTLSNTTPYTGASHIISPTLYLGSRVDADDDGQPVVTGAAATNDDDGVTAAAVGGTGDDEDGINFLTDLVAGQVVTVEVTVSGTGGYLNGWIDFDGDGVWTQADNQIFDGAAVSAGSNTLTFTVPLTASTGITTYARFRLSTAADLNFYDAGGPAPDGEVEDYDVLILPLVLIGDRLWIEDDNDGNAGTGTVTPVGAGQGVTATSATTGQVYTDTTDANGYYTITVPANDTYVVTTDLPGGGVVDTPVHSNDGSNPANNNDLNHARAGTTVVVTTTNNLSIDFGFFQSQPTIEVIKYTNGDDADTPTGPTVAVGSVVTWTYDITNTGNVTLTDVTLVDDREGGITCPQNTLLPGAGMTCILTGTAVAGQYVNTAIVTGTPTLGPVTPVTDTNPSHYYGATAGLGDRVWYDTDRDGLQDGGETGVSSVTVQLLNNSGNVVSTTTTSASGYYSFTDLAPGVYSIRFVTSTLPSGYLITLRDAGSDNAADSDADPATGRTVNTVLEANEYDPTWDLGIWQPQPVIDVVKYTNGEDADTPTGPTVAVGSVVTWTYAITNTGNVTLTNIALADDMEGSVICPVNELAPGAGMTCVLTGTATAGQYANTAIVTGTPTLGPVTPVTDTNPSHYFGATAGIGDRVWYDVNYDGIQDSGETGVANVTVELLDSGGGVVSTTQTSASGYYSFTNLVPGVYSIRFVTSSLPAGYIITLRDAGSDNAADSDADPTTGHTVNTLLTNNEYDPDWDLGIFLPQPTIDVIKYTNGVDADSAPGVTIDVGDPVTWTYAISNTGNVTLTNVTLDDDVEGSVTCPLAELAPHAGMTCVLTGTAIVGPYANTAVVTGTPTLGGPLGAVTPVTDTNPSHYTNAPTVLIGDRLWIEDDNDGDATTGNVTPVGAGHVVTATSSSGVVYTDTTDANGLYTITVPANATYTVTTDLPGGVVDTPIHAADGADLGNNDRNHDRAATTVVVTLTDNLSIDFGFFQPQPTIEVIKYTNGDDANAPSGPTVAVGSVVTWTYDITNSGNVTLTNIALADDMEGSVTCPVNQLAPGAGMTCILTGTALAGQYANTAIVTGTPTLGPVTPVTDTNPSHYYGATAGIGDRVWYDVNYNGIQDGGETGVMSVTVELLDSAGAVISTTTTNATGYYSFTDLAPGLYGIRFVTSTLPAGYIITLRDVGIDNAADSDADPVTGRTVNTLLTNNEYDPDWDLGIFQPQPTIEVIKYTNGDDADAPSGPTVAVGSGVTWTYDITNTGNVTLTNVTLVDDREGGITCPLNELAPSAGMTCILTGTAVAGQYVNTAIVTGTPTIGPVTPVTDTNPSHYTGLTAGLGDRVWYDTDRNGIQDSGETGVPNVTVQLLNNSGNVFSTTTTSVSGYYSFTDLAPGVYSIRFVTSTLPSGYLITLRDAGNDATDSDADPTTGRTVNTLLGANEYDPTWDLGIWAPQPTIAVIKYTNGEDADLVTGPIIALGDTVTWTYVVTNTGNVTLTNITLGDDVEGSVSCPVTELAPSAGMTCVLTGTATAGQYANTAIVTGTPTLGPVTTVTDTNPSHYYGGNPGLVLRKYTNGYDADTVTGPFIAVGDVVTWTYVITNTGNQTLTNLALVDSVEGVITCPVTELAAGASTVCTWSGTASSGQYTNTAVVSGTTPGGSVLTFTNPSHYYGVDPSIAIKKYTNGEDADTVPGPTVNAGATVTWTYVVTNTGTVALTDINLSDDVEGTIACPMPELAVGASMTCTWTGTASSGQYTNTAVVTGTPNIPTNPIPDLPGYPTLPTPNDPVTDTNPSHYFGHTISIGDYVWVDGNGNGVQDEPSTSGMAGVTVTLTLPDGSQQVAYTDASGSYSFTNLLPNTVYTVTFAMLDGYSFTNPNLGSDDSADSDAPANGVVVVTTGATDDWTIDAGLVSGVNVGNYVWFDADKDGSQDANELGIAGAVVALFLADGVTPATDLGGATVVSQATGSDGLYNFGNLPEGGYVVQVTMPAGYSPTINQETNANTDDDTDSNIDSSSGSIHSSGVVTLTISGEPAGGVDTDGTNGNLTVDFGFIGVNIGDYVWVDEDGDGRQDSSEPGIEGVTITLTTPTGAVITTTTDANGVYTFTNLLPNATYTVTFVTPTGYSFTNPNQGSDDAADSDAPATGVVVIATGTTDDLSIDAGLVSGVNVGNYVWFDTDKDGRQDANESGIAGAVVELFAADGVTPAVDLSGATVPTQTTGANGLYNFVNLPVGGYVVQVTMPAGYSPTINQIADPNSDDDTDSNIATSVGNVHPSDVVTLTISGEPASGIDTDGTNGNLTVDFGFIGLNIGDYVWADEDGDGQQDGTEPGVEGVTITLTTPTGAIITTTTDANGVYTFTNLLPNSTYTVTFSTPDGYSVTTPNQGGDDTGDSDAPANGVVVVTLGTTDNLTIDAGLVQGVNVGNYVWFDTDKDGTQDNNEPGIAGAIVALFEADGTTPAVDLAGNVVSSQTTGSDGLYNFSNLPVGGYVVQVTMPAGYSATPVQVTDANTDDDTDSNIAGNVGQVYSSGVVTLTISGEPSSGVDTDATNGNLTVDFGFIGVNLGNYVWVDVNGDGGQDEAAVNGLGGVTVTLTTATGAVMTATTDATGYYTFTNLMPNAPYTVTFLPPTGYEFTTPNVGGDAQDSDVLNSGVVVVTLGVADDWTIDAGLIQAVGVGNYVWFDSNVNGLQDANEPGIAGAMVELLDPALNPVVDLNGNAVLSQTTGSDGHYIFGNLRPGSYIVQVTMPTGYSATINQVVNPNTDADIDSNIASSNGQVHQSGVVTLTVGAEPTNEQDESVTLPDANSNLSVDFGFIGVNLGDYVWVDENGDGQQDGSEPSIEGVTVTLTTPTGAVITTTTDASGVYTFTNLTPNSTYTVTFSTPAGYSFTTPNQGSDSSDSDASATGVVVVTLGTTDNLTIDAGLVQAVNVGNYVWFDTDKDGTQDANELGIAGAVLTLFKADGVTPATDLSGAIVPTQTTGSDGLYNFTNLPVGGYVVQVAMPAGYSATPIQVANVNTDIDTDSNIASSNGSIHTSGVVTLTISAEPASNIDTDGTNGNLTVDFGFIGVNLGDYVWVDGNGNGVQDEPATSGKVGVTVTLTLPDGSALTTVTNASGYYSFTNLVPNTTYTVSFSLPDGYSFTNPNQGGDDSADSDAPANGVVVINLGSQNDLTIDAGLVSGVNVGNYIWFDTDKDGLQDVGEPGIAGAIVELFQVDGTTPAIDLSGNAVASQTTSADGLYTFGNLPEGGYVVKVTMPAGYSATPVQETDANTNDDTDSNIAGNIGQVYSSSVVTLTINGEPVAGVDTDGTNGNLTVDFGFIGVNLGDYVWVDSDRDGRQDATEIGISAVTVILTWPNGITATTTTDTNGGYLFTNLLPNQIYTVTFVAPAGYLFTLPNVGADQQDSDAPTNGVVVVTLGTSDDLTIDVGLYQPAGIGDRVWYDDNRNHVQDGNDVGVAGVTVALLDGSGAVISTTTTNASGYYSFTNLTPGDYALRFVTSTLPSGYVLVMANAGAATVDSDANQTSGATTLTTLTSGEYDPTWDAGIYQRLASLGDTVWEDLDHDGIQDPNEPGIPAVMVTLTDANGLTATVPTDANGHYTFTNLLPGAPYTVTFTTPAGYAPTLTDVGDDITDSDGRQVVVTLQPGEHNPTIDSGFWRPLSLGNQVWEDLNNNGIKDGAEAGVAGVTVNLYRDSNNDGEPDGAAIATMTTDGDGLYLFTGLTSDNYLVEIVAPVGYVSSTPDAGDADVDSDDSDDNGIGTGAGVIRSHAVTLVVGAEPVGENPDNDLVTPDSNENLTVDFGICGCPLGAVNLGNYVWLDSDRDGQQDGSESGVANVVVTLQLPTGVVITTTTDATGHYTFTNLLPNQRYVVTFTPPIGFSLTLLNQGDDALDSDPDNRGEVTVTLGTTDDYTIDAGLVINPVRVGDVAFIDMNLNGRQDAGDEPLPGTLLHLTKADGGGPLGAVTDIFGNPVPDQTTDGSGHYLFTNLLPGEYSVHVVSVPTGYAPTTPNVGSPDLDSSTGSASSSPTTGTAAVPGGEDLTLDFGFVPLVSLGNLVWHDVDNNGQVDVGERGIPNVTLQLFHAGDNPLTAMPVATDVTDSNGNYLFENLLPGSYFVYIPTPPPAYPLSSTSTDNTDNGEDNDDNGSQPTPGEPVLSPIIDLTPGGEPTNDGDGASGDLTVDFGFCVPASLGDRVWYDTDKDGIQDPGETGVTNVLVTLYEAVTNTIVATTTTNSDGRYLFGNLLPGDYVVQFTQPDGYNISPVNQGNRDDRDSDADPNNQLRTPVTNLEPGEHNLTLDMGLYLPVAPAAIGDRVWFDKNKNGIQDPGETGVPGVTVELHRADGILVATTTTAANGRYEFNNLLPGDYYLTFIPPTGYQLSPQDQGDQTDGGAGDSDVNPANGQTVVTTLRAGENDPSWDLGLFLPIEPASIGDMVWFDSNINGIQDAGELGVPGVQVMLYTAADVLVATTTTNGDGYYAFTNLAPGDYYVVFNPPVGVISNTPITFIGTLQDQGANDAVDSDADPLTGATPVTTLIAGENDPTWDYGVYLVDLFNRDLLAPGGIGDQVWIEVSGDNIFSNGEQVVAGVIVNLYDTNGILIATDVTDANGQYNLPNLLPGDYYLEFVLPDDFVFIQVFSDESTIDNDSNVDPNTGLTTIITVDLADNDPNWDAGVYIPPTTNLGDENEPNIEKPFQLFLPVIER